MKTTILSILKTIILSLFFVGIFITTTTQSQAQNRTEYAIQNTQQNTNGQVAEENDGGRTALFLLDYSLGINNNNNCLSCTFVQEFILALSSFSAAVFMYFRAFFISLLPLFMATWIAWNVGKLMIAGGSDGRGFILDVVKKSTLFFFLWMIMVTDTGSTSTDPTETMTVADAQDPWSWFGPEALEFGFQLGNEVRTLTSQSLVFDGIGVRDADIETQIGFNCETIVQNGNNQTLIENENGAYDFAWQASQTTCAIERTHIVGIAMGLAIIEGSFAQIEGLSLSAGILQSLKNFFGSLLNAIIMTVVGLAMIVVFALSAIWFVFLVLDIIVKVLIIAGLSPLLLLFALFKPTRNYAWSAFRGGIGALVTALGLAIVASLAFYLVLNLPNVYNTANSAYDPALRDINAGDSITAFREFIFRMQIDDNSNPNLIPVNLTTPWYHYMMLVSLAIFALGKKIISMIEGIIGAQALSEMADNARKLAVIGGGLGIGGAFLGMQAGGMAARGGLQGLGLLAGGTALGANRLGQAVGSSSDRLKNAGSWLVERSNPIGAFVRNRKQNQGRNRPSLIEQATRAKDQAQKNLDDLSNDGQQ